tara:strand:+ start:140101 stop:143418 length:3318 start_codon:yes stop_codon:yes gene_type:complete
MFVLLIAIAFCRHDARGQSARPESQVALPIAVESFVEDLSETGSNETGWSGDWVLSRTAPAIRKRTSPAELTDFGAEICGTKDRNNPLRRQLSKPFDGAELFVRFLISYDELSIDKVPQSDGEFFVLWLDSVDGGDSATHSSGVPNIGLHVDSQNRNAFMVRFGSDSSSFAPVELTGDRTFLVAARVAKSSGKKQGAFDQIELWVNPSPAEPTLPHAATFSPGRVKVVNWLGFSTGRKTETADRIIVDDLVVADSWEGLFSLPRNSVTFPKPERVAEKLLNEAAEIPVELRPRREMLKQPTVSFRRDIFPILERSCFQCHRGLNPTAGYRLDLLEEILGETNGEPLAQPGDSAGGRLVKAVSAESDSAYLMPPEGKGERLSDKEVALIQTWIQEGLAWDDDLLPPASTTSDHWAFQRVERPSVPAIKRDGFPIQTPVDSFIAAAHVERGICAVAVADRSTLNRRVALDLLGLPAGFVELTDSAIQQNQEPAASAVHTEKSNDEWARHVDRLLDLPQYGERWGRHWLDVARWAESNGYQHNRERDHAWRYRDYVIDSFNADKPFDQFVTEQLAGDELEPLTDEHIIATGFLAAAQYSGNEKNKTLQRYDILVDVVNATGNAMLGLTFECCQCHNHKFDPISARDYYRFQAFFAKGQPVNVVLPGGVESRIDESDQEATDSNAVFEIRPDAARQIALCKERQTIFNLTHDRLFAAMRRNRPEGDIFILPTTVVKGMRPPERQRYDEIGQQLAEMPQAWAFYSPVNASAELAVPPLALRWPLPYEPAGLAAHQQRLFVRGDAGSPGPVVSPGWPAVFGNVPASVADSAKPRTELARWMISRDNPLTARVWVNRIWQGHFGQGLVEEAGNFGLTTPQPELHELLDWLAVELMESGWSTKHIHRLILNSSTYRLSSTFDENNAVVDPDNRLFWRWVPRRLEAETLRDRMLASSGELSLEFGGPGVRDSVRAASFRRSVYQFQKRNVMPHMQDLFDGPSALTSCSTRRVSTVPLQPLFLLNSGFVHARARKIAARLLSGSADEKPGNAPAKIAADQIERAFLLILGRSPDDEELSRSIDFLATPTASIGPVESLTQYCHALLNLNEFAYIP